MLDSFKDVVSTIKEAVVSPAQEAFTYRAKNPFFGSLIISWLYWNWDKLAFFLLSDMPVLKRINFVKHKIPDNSIIFGLNVNHTHSFYYPLIAATIFTLSLPVLIYSISRIHSKITTSINALNATKEEERWKQQEKVAVAYEEYEGNKAKARVKWEEDYALSIERIETSRKNTQAIRTTFDEYSVKISNLETDLSSLESTIAAQVARRDSLTLEIQKINEEYVPLKEDNDIKNNLAKQLVESKATIQTQQSEITRLNEEIQFTKINTIMDLNNRIGQVNGQLNDYKKTGKNIEELYSKLKKTIYTDEKLRFTFSNQKDLIDLDNEIIDQLHNINSKD